ncbi:MAG: hypothetical protein IPO94_02200 [Saprospiraceae bacterium]|nr:hypothetical protein [Saprospiraceae bacterium]
MKYGKTIVLLIFMLQTQTAIFGQKITVSREINVRNNYAYDILPNIEDHIIFYHDRGIEHVFEIYDQNLRFKHEIQPEFEKDNIIPTGVMAMDSTFHFSILLKKVTPLYLEQSHLTKMLPSRTLSLTIGNIKKKLVAIHDLPFQRTSPKW